jgi:hypothetical protein
MALLQTFQDDFNDDSFDTTTRWDVIDTQPFERSGRLECPAGAGISYYGTRSKSTYDLTGSRFFVEIVAPPFSLTDAEFQIQVRSRRRGSLRARRSRRPPGIPPVPL